MSTLETNQRFSQSLLWELQNRYFATRGIEAWRGEEVPHYVTSNPTIARSYAEVVFALRQDRQRLQPGTDEPLTICELGAGSGRFAFHFLRALGELCGCEPARLPGFRYVLTDFTQANLDAWKLHPYFKPWFDSGVLDVALCDVSRPADLVLQVSGQHIGPGTLGQPLAVIANYVFDSVPQELVYVNEGQVHECLVSLDSEQGMDQVDGADFLERLQIQLDYAPCAISDPLFDELLTPWRELKRAHVLLPLAGLRCLEHLRTLSQSGLLLLSADKGSHRLDHVALAAPPALAFHGSFSLGVNYRAFDLWCQRQGGMVFDHAETCESIAVAGLLLVPEPAAHVLTARAWQRHVADSGPDDFFAMTKLVRRQFEQMSVADMLAFLRFCRADPRQLAYLMPLLLPLASTFTPAQADETRRLARRAWDNYFPLGEDHDLAFDIGCLLHAIGFYADALGYFEQSIDIYGAHIGTLYNLAACLIELNEPAQVRELLEAVLAEDPDYAEARKMLETLEQDEREQAGQLAEETADAS